MSDLELIATDALLEELFTRFDQGVFCGRKMVTSDENAFEIGLRGDAMAAAGLCDWIKWNIMACYDERGSQGGDDGIDAD